MKLQKPKGTQDILPGESAKWQYVEGFARKVFARYNYEEIRTPIFEHYEVISRSVGDTTDIVTKEMYDFYDKGDRHITLRPEGTAPVVRSYVENKLFAPEVQKPSKFYYMGPTSSSRPPASIPPNWSRMLWIEQSSNGCRNHCYGSAIPERIRD